MENMYVLYKFNHYGFLSGAFSYIFLRCHFSMCSSALQLIWHDSVFTVTKLCNVCT